MVIIFLIYIIYLIYIIINNIGTIMISGGFTGATMMHNINITNNVIISIS